MALLRQHTTLQTRYSGYCIFIRYWLYLCLFVCTPGQAGVDPVNATSPVSIASLVDTADRLVQEAISSNANASRFRIDTTLYRESLRSLMLEAEQTTHKATQSRPAFMELVRMSALLQSAAACKTGRFIVCPVELRQQLLAQQQRLYHVTPQEH